MLEGGRGGCQTTSVVLVVDDNFEIDLELYELRWSGASVPLEPQAFDVLAYLVRHRDRVVSKEELMDQVWGGRFVTEAAVTGRIKQVRRALGDDGHAQRTLRTVHGRGYHFVADVHEARSSLPAEASVRSGGDAPIRYTVSDGLHIAYQVTGGETPAAAGTDIVLIAGFISHVEQDWEDPGHRRFLDRLGAMGRLIRFDKRGTGMSDRPPGVPDLETRMHDVLAVMDAAGSARAVLLGYSEGGAMATLMAATHPERVEGLVLYASYAKRTRSEDYPWAQTEERRLAYTEELVTRWDWEADLLFRAPSGSAAMQRWWARRMRAAATPGTVRALLNMNGLVDVRHVLGSVRQPALVLHRRGDTLFQVEEAQYLAEHMPAATLRLLGGVDHLPMIDPDQICDEVEDFLRTRSRPQDVRSALVAVVAAAGTGSDRLVASLLAAGGRPRTRPAGRPVVVFDGPARAVRAALAQPLGQRGVGVSLAELPVAGERADGQSVGVAVALADAAPPGEVWVSTPTGTCWPARGCAPSRPRGRLPPRRARCTRTGRSPAADRGPISRSRRRP